MFTLKKIGADKVLQNMKADGNNYKDDDFSVSASGPQFTYAFNNGEFIKVSYVQAANRLGGTGTHTWDKYGNRIEKSENRMAGIYIMANNGQINDMRFSIDSVSVSKGKLFTKIFLARSYNNIVVTMKNSERNIIDLQTAFKPEARDFNDYFIKV